MSQPVLRSPRLQSLLQWLKCWLPALPLLILAYGLLVVPLIALMMQSFLDSDGSFTLDHWRVTFASRMNRQAIVTSLTLSFTSATIALIVGGPVAWLISQMAIAPRSIWLSGFNMATNFSGIGLAFGFVAILGTYGMLTLALRQMGIAFTPPTPGSFWGLAIAYSYLNIPLFVLLTIPGMSSLRHEWWEAAQVSGATRWQFWQQIGVPLLAPFLAAGWMLTFTWSLGLYGLPFALGVGTTPSLSLLSVQLGRGLEASMTGRGEAAVLAIALLLLTGSSLLAYQFLLRRVRRWL
ncbi:MAG TPA: ABC transporter permease subunit [Crinalium sp.]